MGGNGTTNYDDYKISKKCCSGIKGVRLNPRRFSVQRLRTNFLYIFKVFRRWRNSYKKCLRLLRRNLQVQVRGRSRKAGRNEVMSYGYSSSTTSYSAVRTMNHSNSFCSEAIADCLEFIKRNSISSDDDMKPMLN